MQVAAFLRRSRVGLVLGVLLSGLALAACERRVPPEVPAPKPGGGDPGVPSTSPMPPASSATR